MGKVYHILLIDDEQSDIKLIETELNKLDIQIQIDIIQTEEELISRLENNPPDLVISDYNLPTLTGTDALQVIQDQHPQLPFILVAGSIGEEKAINVMLQGASDYAMKQNLDRLGPTILRELVNYEDHKKQSRQLERTHSRYENLLGSVNGIVWEADAETIEFIYVSPQSEQLLGYYPGEWLAEPNFWQKHIHPENRKEAIHFCQHETQQGMDHSFEYRMIDASGEVVWLRDYVTVLTENGEPNRLCGFMVDISREKKAERQRDKAYEFAHIGHWELDLINEELYWSKAVKKLHEVGLDYEPDLDTALEFYKEGEHRQKITTAVETAIETGESFEIELQIITRNGNEKWVRVIGETEFRNGKCMRIYGSTQDISERKVSEKKYRDIFNLSPQPMWVYDPETLKFLDVNRAAINHYGFRYEEFMNMTLKDIRPEYDIPNLMKAVKEIHSKKDSYYEGLFRHKTKEESIIHVNIKRNTIDYEGRKASMVLAEDVTEKLEIERELQLSEQRFKSLVQDGSDLMAILDQNGNYTYVAPTSESVLGISPEEFIGNNALEYIHDKHEGRIQQVLATLPEKKRTTIKPFLFKDGKGEWRWIETIITNLLDNPAIEGFIANSRDVTAQIEREQSLRELYQKNRLILESTGEGIYGIDTEGRCTFINKAAANMLGYQSKEYIGKNMHDLIHHKHVNGTSYPESECPIFVSKNKHESCKIVDEVFWRNDETCFNVEYTSNPMIKEGEIKGAVVAFSDITERKQQENELQESLKEKETLLMEIHHRVKNNLAVVSGMMQMQVFEEEDENVKQKLSGGINRIQTMGSIHELLYQSESFSRIDADKNIRKLVSDIVNTFKTGVKLDIEFNLQEISLNINQAIPFSLIVNEVITNAMKHAFRDRNQGIISVSLAEEDNVTSIQILDNGKGLPDNFENMSKNNSLGLTLIDTLATQLDGKYNYEVLDQGTLFTLSFEKADVKGIGNARLK